MQSAGENFPENGMREFFREQLRRTINKRLIMNYLNKLRRHMLCVAKQWKTKFGLFAKVFPKVNSYSPYMHDIVKFLLNRHFRDSLFSAY